VPSQTKFDYFPEVYAAREKVGVYIPKERYQQEENERKVVFDIILSLGESLLFHLRNDFSCFSLVKAMADQIEKMTALLEADQKVNVCGVVLLSLSIL
jgi:kinesin family member 11